MSGKRSGFAAQVEPALAVLGREFSIRLLNCSPSGCLFETNSQLAVGTIASLTVKLHGEEFTDDLQVVRCQPIEGAGSVYHVGAQFLWMATPTPGSLRQVIRRASSMFDPSPVSQ